VKGGSRLMGLKLKVTEIDGGKRQEVVAWNRKLTGGGRYLADHLGDR